MATEPADWTKQGITFDGGSRDGEVASLFPGRLESMNFSKEIAGEEIVELYERTDQARDGRTVYRFVRRQRDLEN